MRIYAYEIGRIIALPNGPAATGPNAARRPGIRAQRMVRQMRREMRRHADRPDAGSAAAMRDAERLVQVEMADIGADRRGAGQPDLRVEVGAVHVDLAAARVDDLADLADRRLEHAVRLGIGHHQRRQIAGMLVRLGAQIGDIDVAVAVAADHHHLQSRHRGAGRIGAVRAGGDQADVAVALAA